MFEREEARALPRAPGAWRRRQEAQQQQQRQRRRRAETTPTTSVAVDARSPPATARAHVSSCAQLRTGAALLLRNCSGGEFWGRAGRKWHATSGRRGFFLGPRWPRISSEQSWQGAPVRRAPLLKSGRLSIASARPAAGAPPEGAGASCGASGAMLTKIRSDCSAAAVAVAAANERVRASPARRQVGRASR